MSKLNTQQVNDYLQQFKQDPKSVMQSVPPKYDAEGNPVEAPSLFPKDDIESGAYIEKRDGVRRQITQQEDLSRAGYASNDRPQDLVDNFVHDRLDSIESAGLMAAALSETPWSDDYWGIYKGLIACRYADPAFPASLDWKVNFDYVRMNDAQSILASGDPGAIDLLSPAEKYDALVGDAYGTLTRQMWNEGRYYYNTSGTVESWMGICHGWAPAAYMLPRPTGTVTVQAADGTPLTFYPSDIKALATLLWANVPAPTRFVGGRCNDQNPTTDPVTGRVISAQCFDTNPATWLLSVVNQIGVSQRSLVLDATYDYQVWNQPMYSYEYVYFNPAQMVYTADLSSATVARGSFQDPFDAYRSPAAAYITGIAMRVGYVVETAPSHRPDDSPAYDSVQYVDYLFDIEQDASGRVIGGEWYSNAHPDFLWTPTPTASAVTRYDYMATGGWWPGYPLPQSWQVAAQYASQADRAPLAAIVEHLIRFANS